jgi:hypothetical protein
VTAPDKTRRWRFPKQYGDEAAHVSYGRLRPVYGREGTVVAWHQRRMFYDRDGQPRLFLAGRTVQHPSGVPVGLFAHGVIWTLAGEGVGAFAGATGLVYLPPFQAAPAPPRIRLHERVPTGAALAEEPTPTGFWSKLGWDEFLATAVRVAPGEDGRSLWLLPRVCARAPMPEPLDVTTVAAMVAPLVAAVPDPRLTQGRRHPLPAILTLVALARLAGVRGLKATVRWGRQHPPATVRAMGFTRDRAPDLQTFSRIVQALDVDDIDALVGRWATTPVGEWREGTAVERFRLPSSDGKQRPAVRLVAGLLIEPWEVIAGRDRQAATS